jgi:hypothetical protein
MVICTPASPLGTEDPGSAGAGHGVAGPLRGPLWLLRRRIFPSRQPASRRASRRQDTTPAWARPSNSIREYPEAGWSAPSVRSGAPGPARAAAAGWTVAAADQQHRVDGGPDHGCAGRDAGRAAGRRRVGRSLRRPAAGLEALADDRPPGGAGAGADGAGGRGHTATGAAPIAEHGLAQVLCGPT